LAEHQTMKTTMRSLVRDYLAGRRALGFRLRSEGYLLLSFARYADRHFSQGLLTSKLAIAWAKLRRVIVHEGHSPRIHDLRHTHACRVLQHWQASRQGAYGRVLILSRYLGHRHVRDTYWYLHALPELMAGAGKRFEHYDYENP
jgi:integrase/recombinase XerD